MGITTPISRLLRRRTSPVFTAFCDGALALSAAAAIVPSHPWACMVAAVLATLPEWLNIAQDRRCAKMTFAPDPLAPDFSAFTTAFLESVAKCTMEGTPVKWTLCPYCDDNGAFAAYHMDLRPARGEMAVGTDTHGQCSTTDIVFRPRLPLPIEVHNTPVTLVLSPTDARRQVIIDAHRRITWPWNRREGNWVRDDVSKLWAAVAFAILAAFPNSEMAVPERLTAIAVLLVFATFALARKKG